MGYCNLVYLCRIFQRWENFSIIQLIVCWSGSKGPLCKAPSSSPVAMPLKMRVHKREREREKMNFSVTPILKTTVMLQCFVPLQRISLFSHCQNSSSSCKRDHTVFIKTSISIFVSLYRQLNPSSRNPHQISSTPF